MYKEGLPSKLQKAREESGFTQKEVANETGIDQSTIARYETGERKPNIENLGILADFYEISVDWLLGTNPSKKNNSKKGFWKYGNEIEQKHKISIG